MIDSSETASLPIELPVTKINSSRSIKRTTVIFKQKFLIEPAGSSPKQTIAQKVQETDRFL